MQLSASRKGRVSRGLGLLTAGLFAATGLQARVSDATLSNSPECGGKPYFGDEPANELGTLEFDSAVFFYQEEGGRVSAIEPASTFVFTTEDKQVFSFGIVYDTLTGATPNGATPWRQTQTFTNPASAPTTVPSQTATTTTSASGTQVVVITSGNTTIYGQQSSVAPHALPVDKGFQDKRRAINAAYSTPIAPRLNLSVGGNYSTETDYGSIVANLGISADFNDGNTTLTFGTNYEHDVSKPHFGNPTPLAEMSAEFKGPAQTKSVVSFIAGMTQVITREWLGQLNYSYGTTSGYQNDPYKIISLIDTDPPGEDTPATVTYLYESRPETRMRHSIYVGNKLAIGSNVTDVSARFYSDSWGIASQTFDVAERIPINSWFYVEPRARYYTQSAADFFRYYLVESDPLPAHASSDYRLAKFSATTLGLKLGFKPIQNGEFYVRGEFYEQRGDAHPPGVISALANEALFAGVKATTFIAGYGHSF
jgi:hypothetical protein